MSGMQGERSQAALRCDDAASKEEAEKLLKKMGFPVLETVTSNIQNAQKIMGVLERRALKVAELKADLTKHAEKAKGGPKGHQTPQFTITMRMLAV